MSPRFARLEDAQAACALLEASGLSARDLVPGNPVSLRSALCPAAATLMTRRLD